MRTINQVLVAYFLEVQRTKIEIQKELAALGVRFEQREIGFVLDHLKNHRLITEDDNGYQLNKKGFGELKTAKKKLSVISNLILENA